MLSGSRVVRRRLLNRRRLCCRCYSDSPLRPPQEWLEGKAVRGQWDSEDNSSEQSERPLLQRRRVFSGIQPTGVPHLGNYLGALRQWKLLHDSSANTKLLGDTKHDQFFSVVDLHALTSSDVPGHVRRKLRRESYASLMAIGLQNTQQTTLFFQSDVKAHTELMWILSTIASTGYLSRMTQWKSKLNLSDDADLHSDEATAKLKLGLFSYPVLQAADILLYQATLVPVGADQIQHIEFARSLARSFNSHVRSRPESSGNVFRVPWPALSAAQRIMSLKRPTQKMSKSDPDPKSRILVTDTREEIHAKIKGAITDSEPGISYDPEKRPGVSNLIDILRNVTSLSLAPEAIAKDLENMTMRGFKEMVADNICESLEGVRDRFEELMNPSNQTLNMEAEEGAKKARRVAIRTMRSVKNSLGLESFCASSNMWDREMIRGSDPDHATSGDFNTTIRYVRTNDGTADAIQEALVGVNKQSFPVDKPNTNKSE
ncbi:tryptophan-tRNA ligase [Exophiala spinifera]|uniref:tryptophan--tRNA ligase n=1 Tax=Exophiala spinifera TaxID=91928 RepID=A0A0D2BE49_9EURO|nr:tryptophan-tRNA ligase [Exophiala spinifera]KIW17258.1 tryptophan-tRNA ligase [Exophiala spinifera]